MNEVFKKFMQHGTLRKGLGQRIKRLRQEVECSI